MSARETCWTACRDAARGGLEDRELFVERYRTPVRAWLCARWPSGPLTEEVDDVEREVFEVCFTGALAGAGDPPEERAFRRKLLAEVRAAAERVEAFHRKEYGEPPAVGGSDAELDGAFDAHFARQVVRDAAARQKARAMMRGQEPMRRAELLRLRVRHGLDPHAVATRWRMDPAVLHREEKVARGEFDTALREVLAYHCEGDEDLVEDERDHLLDVLSHPRLVPPRLASEPGALPQ